jgi:hypothetical protein
MALLNLYAWERSPFLDGTLYMDSQSVKTTNVSGIRGYDGGKKLNGRK